MMKFKTSAGITALLIYSASVQAQQAPEANNVIDPPRIEDEIVVVGTSRLPETIEVFPGTVRIIDTVELEKISSANNDLGAILGNYVPGFSPSGSQTSGSNYDQTLRGRIPSVFIDGVPVTTTLRNGRQDIRALHPDAIGSIEIVSGSSTLYGNGGAGGIVNYVTKRPVNEDVQFSTEIGGDISLTNVDDSFSPSFMQTASGDLGLVDFIATGTIEKAASYFDADGERIAPNPNLQIGLADSLIQNYIGKIGFGDAAQRLELTALYYKQSQDTDYINGVGDVSEGIPTPAIIGENDPSEIDNGNENLLLNAVYSHEDLIPSTRLRVQGYTLNVDNTFSYTTFYPGGGQSVVEARKYGARLDLDTDLSPFYKPGGRLLYGIDYLNDSSEQPLVDGRTFVPEVTQDNLAFFAQMELPLTENFQLSGGIRHEDFNLTVESFNALFSGASVTGGDINFSDTTFNLGGVYSFENDLSAFASYSQGSPVAEIGRILRSATEDIDIDTFDLEPSVTESYEAGVRYNANRLRAELVVFQNESTLGSTVTFNPTSTQFIVQRAPEEVQGLELSVDYDVNDLTHLGGSFTLMEGERDSDGDGSVDAPLSGQTIPPAKVSAYAERSFINDWFVRGQLSYTGERNEFPGSTSFGQGKVNDRLLVDLTVRKSIGNGQLKLALHNLFNEDYFTHTSEIAQLPDRYSKGPGRGLSVSYRINY